MSLKDFMANPWKASHPVYEASQFNIRPAPEYATAEVVAASLYRACGFMDCSERDVPKNGRELDRKSTQSRSTQVAPGFISAETWRTILHGVLESPKRPNQSSRRFLSLCPVVPDAALYSGSARLTGNSWNPGALVMRIICIGSKSSVEAHALWDRLFDALSVAGHDDIWARWLQEEFRRHNRSAPEWRVTGIEDARSFPYGENARLKIPARQFVADLDAVFAAKGSMTRRQWISLLEAILRIGIVTHVLWLCSVNAKLWGAMSSILGLGPGEISHDESEIRQNILGAETRYLSLGNPAMAVIKNYASGYLVARVGINAALWMMSEIGAHLPRLDTPSDIMQLLSAIRQHRNSLVDSGVRDIISTIHDQEARSIACKKGIGSNLVEFAQYTLCQRRASDESLRGYDQSYFLAKKSDAPSSHWIVSIGPVAVLAIVHCCLREARSPRSVRRFADHLSNYGIEVDIGDISLGDLGRKLRMLGLVLDSPDAETGMLLIPPFAASALGVST